jgi:hypothetical protein
MPDEFDESETNLTAYMNKVSYHCFVWQKAQSSPYVATVVLDFAVDESHFQIIFRGSETHW